MKKYYRSDIDGLRAVAVSTVVAFHYGTNSTPGGFVGVDIFFVISGYLITGIIEREIQQGHFSVLDFYHRRIRRIFPAMYMMLFVSSVLTYILMLPDEAKAFGKTLFYVTIFSANILFYRHSGYFDASSERDPLLHMWTLAVEEQFYLICPLVLLLLTTLGARAKTVLIILVVIISVSLSGRLVDSNPNFDFYLLPTRAWELGVGALLSLLFSANAVPHWLSRPVYSNSAGILGLAMISAAVISFNNVMPFPGTAALLPCLGAALVIASSEMRPSIGGRILSWRPLVFVGRISFSVYLWHWPILVYCRLAANSELSRNQLFGAAALSFLLGYLSWRYVEIPFRRQLAYASPWKAIRYGLLASMMFAFAGSIFFVSGGLPARSREIAEWLNAEKQESRSLQSSTCLKRGPQIAPATDCLMGSSTTDSARVVLWGDSHAAQLAPAVSDELSKLSLAGRQITKAGCFPVPNVEFFPKTEMLLDCREFNDKALNAILDDPAITTVILASRWDTVARGDRIASSTAARTSLKDSRHLFFQNLRRAVSDLSKSRRSVILIGQVPIPPFDPIDCLGRARLRDIGAQSCLTFSIAERALLYRDIALQLRDALAGIPNVTILSPIDKLCQIEICRMASIDSEPLFLDDLHVSHLGAKLVMSDLNVILGSQLDARGRK